MVKPEIIEQKPISISEVKDLLKVIHKRDEELTFRGGKTEEYVNDATRLSTKKVKELMKKLEELQIPRLKEQHTIKIADTLPESADHLKVILSGFNVTVAKDNLQKIMDVVEDFRPA